MLADIALRMERNEEIYTIFQKQPTFRQNTNRVTSEAPIFQKVPKSKESFMTTI